VLNCAQLWLARCPAVLLELRVENYAVIDNVVVEFSPGLNLLTGETGAGKSILIDALALLLGDKSSADIVRHGAEKAVISCVFLPEGDGAERVLDANGIESDGEELILKREIAVSGKGRVWVNNQPATVAVLRQLAPELASIHAQNETVMAFDPRSRLGLLDRFAGIPAQPLRAEYDAWRTIRERISDLERDEQDRLRLLDLCAFQKKEIDEAHLTSEEDVQLANEKRVLANAEKVYAAAMSAYDLLYESSTAALTTIRAANRHLQELARFEPKFTETLNLLNAAEANIADVSETARDYAQHIDASPERLAEVEDRLALLERLKRKYGASIDQVIAFGAELGRKLDEFENREEIVKDLRKQLGASASTYKTAAQDLSQKRTAAAKRLEKLVAAQLAELVMKSRFHVEVSGSDDEENWSPSGFDRVSYLIATNPGEPLKPLEEVASGGELSRTMLALKTSIEEGGTTPAAGKRQKSKRQRPLVFDEIDTGIGGRIAEAVGKKLKALAQENQVLCITHLPQIASFADRHFIIEKQESGGRTRTSVRVLTSSERAEEIARMLSGATLTDASLEHAELLLKANA
jgi:DNA repair protein RecN (Recombination protein N)